MDNGHAQRFLACKEFGGESRGCCLLLHGLLGQVDSSLCVLEIGEEVLRDWGNKLLVNCVYPSLAAEWLMDTLPVGLPVDSGFLTEAVAV